MARIIYGALVTAIHGSIGGTTFQKNAHGHTVKNKPNMVLPDSVNQNITKSAVVKCTQKWSDLTDGQRLAWETYATAYPQYAKYNPSARLSGFNVFLLRNLSCYIINGYTLDEPDIIPTTDSILAPTLVSTAGSIILTYNASPSPLYIDCFIWSSPGRSGDRYISRNSMKIVYTTAFPAGDVDLYTNYMLVFGSYPQPGEKVLLQFQCFGDTTGAMYAKRRHLITVT